MLFLSLRVLIILLFILKMPRAYKIIKSILIPSYLLHFLQMFPLINLVLITILFILIQVNFQKHHYISTKVKYKDHDLPFWLFFFHFYWKWSAKYICLQSNLLSKWKCPLLIMCLIDLSFMNNLYLFALQFHLICFSFR